MKWLGSTAACSLLRDVEDATLQSTAVTPAVLGGALGSLHSPLSPALFTDHGGSSAAISP